MSMVQKYMGVEGIEPVIDKMGGNSWKRIKARVKRSAEKIAGDLLKLYAPHAFDKSHYVLSCDVTRVITLPETLNGETGLICTFYNPDQFRVKTMEDVYVESKRTVHITAGLNWQLATEWRNPRFNLGVVI